MGRFRPKHQHISKQHTPTLVSTSPKFSLGTTVGHISERPMSPQTRVRIAVLVVTILLLGALSYFGMTGLAKQTGIKTVADSSQETPQQGTTKTIKSQAQKPNNAPSTAKPGSSTAPSQTGATQQEPNSKQVYCGVVGMPEGVCTAITSIEKNGIKGNPYVQADTSKLPSGSTIKFDRASWEQTTDTTGHVGFTLKVLLTTYKARANFELINGTWKATSHTE